MIAEDALPPLPLNEAPPSLESAWRAAGGSSASYRQRRSISLTEYEEGKLRTAGVDLATSQPFFEKAKALMGERAFELFAAGEAERTETRQDRGLQYGGLKPTNPTGLIIRLAIHRISEQKQGMAESSSKPKRTKAPASTRTAEAPPVPIPVATISKTQTARVEKQMALLEKVADATGDVQTTDVVYCSTAFVVASLPHSDPGTREAWSRTNGKKVLTVRSGWDEVGERQFGLPYGSLPRLMYYFVETEVIRKGEQKIYLGDSLYMFMQSLGISDSAQNYRAMRTQAARLFNASFQITEKKMGEGGVVGVNIKHVPPIAKEAEFWWHTDRKAQQNGELFSSYIVLEDKFFKEMREHGFPLDANAVKYLRQSSLDLDLYAWLSHRNYALNRFDTEAVTISFEALMEQFGSEYARPRDFRSKLKLGLGKIQELWRGGLGYELTKTGLVLKKSPLQIKTR